MLDEYLKNGELTYCKNIAKEGNISKDLFQITYKDEVLYLLCTFDGLNVTWKTLIS